MENWKLSTIKERETRMNFDVEDEEKLKKILKNSIKRHFSRMLTTFMVEMNEHCLGPIIALPEVYNIGVNGRSQMF